MALCPAASGLPEDNASRRWSSFKYDLPCSLTRLHSSGAKGAWLEWHLLKLPRMSMPTNLLSGESPGSDEQRKRFRSTLDGARFDTTGAVAHALFGDQHKQTVEQGILNWAAQRGEDAAQAGNGRRVSAGFLARLGSGGSGRGSSPAPVARNSASTCRSHSAIWRW